jgi:hypothetical protein
MSFEMETDAEIGGGESQFLNEPGTYHCVITTVHEGEGPKGGQIDGFSVGLSVLDGTTKGQEDKQINLCFFSPNLDKSESSNAWARKRQTAFAVAAELIDLAKVGGKVNVNLDDAVGCQIMVNLETNEYQGRSNLQVAYANIYHVDDPRAAKFPKKNEAIELIPKQMRRPAEYFASLTKKANGTNPAAKLSEADLATL